MMNKDNLYFDYSNALSFITEESLEKMKERAKKGKDLLLSRTGPGNDYLGWLDFPVNHNKVMLQKGLTVAEAVRKNSEIFIVIGAGGSYLGSKAAIDFLGHDFNNSISKEIRNAPEIYFVGNNFSSTYIKHLMDVVQHRSFSINVISKSGTTTETILAFRLFRRILEERYGKKEAAKRIIITTDKQDNRLRDFAEVEGYTCLGIPLDIGGRFSVLTSVGLVPIAVAGFDVNAILEGAAHGRERCFKADFEKNEAMQYAVIRNLLYEQGKFLEITCNFNPSLHSIGEWWKQLYAESEGKDNKGIFPVVADYSTDLHALGQYVQEGTRILFETVLHVETSKKTLILEEEPMDFDDLNFLKGESLESINKKVMDSTILAHIDGGVPNLMITIPEQTEYFLGQLFYFYEFACSISGYILGINPFNQPGVENYKNNMYALLGKPGYEGEREHLLKRLEKK